MFLFSYKFGSRSARALSQAANLKRIRHVGSRFRPNPNKTILNWGSSTLPDGFNACSIINTPEAVARASNKLRFFEFLEELDVRTPDVALSAGEVLLDIEDKPTDKVCWLARTVLEGNSGAGIELIYGGQEDIPEARLYTKYVPKQDEYRVHVFNGRVLKVQRKARRHDVPDDEVNWQVRNHSNGFIFAANEDHEAPEDVTNQSVACVRELGLDFGAVDVVWNDRKGEAYVLEVNTAPGLEGDTLGRYVEALHGR